MDEPTTLEDVRQYVLKHNLPSGFDIDAIAKDLTRWFGTNGPNTNEPVSLIDREAFWRAVVRHAPKPTDSASRLDLVDRAGVAARLNRTATHHGVVDDPVYVEAESRNAMHLGGVSIMAAIVPTRTDFAVEVDVDANDVLPWINGREIHVVIRLNGETKVDTQPGQSLGLSPGEDD